MNCMFLTKRSKKNIFFWFCRRNKIKIELKDCSECDLKEFKKYKKIIQKSSKLKNIENKRFSILTNDFSKCYKCENKKQHIHEIYGGRNRQISIRNGFCIPICEKCHRKTEDDMLFDRELKKECQKIFEKDHTRIEFLKLIDKNYLED